MKTIMKGSYCTDLDAKALGKWGEDVAKRYIEMQGLSIVETNYTTKYGEVDIVAKDKLIYHFIEIKTRRGMQHGLPREAVSKRKQKHIKQCAMVFISELRAKKRQWRELSFDVVEVYIEDDFQCRVQFLQQCF